MPRQRKRRATTAEHSPPWLRICVAVLSGPTSALFKLRWQSVASVPDRGPAILVANHNSYADPIVLARFVYDAGRVPRFLAKRPLFAIPVVGAALRGTGQIPVDRGTSDARQSLDQAVEALGRGEIVIIYPEGTVTRDPDWWPMAGRTGAARLALLAPEVPVVPVVHWGSQFAVDFYRHRYRPLPRQTVTVTAGAPLDLRRFDGAVATADTLRTMTDQMMRSIRDLLADVRGEPAPAGPLYRPIRAVPGADARVRSR